MAFPYFVLFEFAVPILELIGIIVLILDLLFFDINYEFLLIVSVFVYLFYTAITLISVLLDQLIYKHYSNIKEIIRLIAMVFVEPFVYHPINVYASLKGYWNFIRGKKQKWGAMSRKGFINSNQ